MHKLIESKHFDSIPKRFMGPKLALDRDGPYSQYSIKTNKQSFLLPTVIS